MRRSSILASACALVLAASLMATPAGATPRTPDTVVDGLAGPLTLAVGNGGDVYVTQSFSGTLIEVDRRGRTRTIHQLSDPENGELVGVAHGRNKTYHIESDYSGDVPTSHVVRTDKRGVREVVSDDFWEHEIANNPDAGKRYGFIGLAGECADELRAWEEATEMPFFSEYTGIVESHAYQLTLSGRDIYVADAAANAILKVNERTGSISTVAVLPVFETKFTEAIKTGLEASLPPEAPPLPDCLVGRKYTPESVPTDVKLDHRGHLYVTTLGGGAGEVAPLSRVYRIDPWSKKATVVAKGLHGATGLDRAPTGHLFVAEMFAGRVSVINPGSSKARTLFEAPSPGDVALSGTKLYATTGVFGEGALVRYDLVRR